MSTYETQLCEGGASDNLDQNMSIYDTQFSEGGESDGEECDQLDRGGKQDRQLLEEDELSDSFDHDVFNNLLMKTTEKARKRSRSTADDIELIKRPPKISARPISSFRSSTVIPQTPKSRRSLSSALPRNSQNSQTKTPLNSQTKTPPLTSTPNSSSSTPSTSDPDSSRSCFSSTRSTGNTMSDSEDSGPASQQSITIALKDMTSLLNTLVKRVEGNSEVIKDIQMAMKTSSSGSGGSVKKRQIPPVVRVSKHVTVCFNTFTCLDASVE